MIYGRVRFEDTILTWDTTHEEEGKVRYTVEDAFSHAHEVRVVDSRAFFNALSILAHNDGMPDYRVDYPEAESVQPLNTALRWIP